METPFKGSISGKGHYRVAKSLGAVFHKITKITLQNALPCELFASSLPYEASKSYRAAKTEFECKRAAAFTEVYGKMMHGL